MGRSKTSPSKASSKKVALKKTVGPKKKI